MKVSTRFAASGMGLPSPAVVESRIAGAAPMAGMAALCRRRLLPVPWPRAGRVGRFAGVFLLFVSVLLGEPRLAAAQDVFADGVREFHPGTNSGTGANLLPGIVLGPPRGGGPVQGALDVLALGSGGSIVLRFDLPVICDGPGPDFTVFENAFHSGSPAGPIFVEYGYVAVSQDGENFVQLPFDAATGVGLAGRTPVDSHPDNGIDPADPTTSGGDTFDLAGVGLAWASYVRITDVGGAIRDIGDLPQFSVAPNAGFDLDAVAAVHACDPGMQATVNPTPSPTPSPMPPLTLTPIPSPSQATATPAAASATVTAAPTQATPVAPTPRPTASPTASAVSTRTAATAVTPTAAGPIAGDLDGDGRVTGHDATRLVGEVFGASRPAAAAADINRDGRVSAADLTALSARRVE